MGPPHRSDGGAVSEGLRMLFNSPKAPNVRYGVAPSPGRDEREEVIYGPPTQKDDISPGRDNSPAVATGGVCVAS